jgi:hypothetical protein
VTITIFQRRNMKFNTEEVSQLYLLFSQIHNMLYYDISKITCKNLSLRYHLEQIQKNPFSHIIRPHIAAEFVKG